MHVHMDIGALDKRHLTVESVFEAFRDIGSIVSKKQIWRQLERLGFEMKKAEEEIVNEILQRNNWNKDSQLAIETFGALVAGLCDANLPNRNQSTENDYSVDAAQLYSSLIQCDDISINDSIPSSLLNSVSTKFGLGPLVHTSRELTLNDICNILKPNNSEVDEMPNFTLREEGCDEDDDDGDDGSPKHRLRSIVMAQRLRSSSGQICKLPSCLKTVTSQNDIKELTRSSLAEFLTQVSGLNFPRVASEPEADCPRRVVSTLLEEKSKLELSEEFKSLSFVIMNRNNQPELSSKVGNKKYRSSLSSSTNPAARKQNQNAKRSTPTSESLLRFNVQNHPRKLIRKKSVKVHKTTTPVPFEASKKRLRTVPLRVPLGKNEEWGVQMAKWTTNLSGRGNQKSNQMKRTSPPQPTSPPCILRHDFNSDHIRVDMTLNSSTPIFPLPRSKIERPLSAPPCRSSSDRIEMLSKHLKHCSGCDTRLRPADQFCSTCGTKRTGHSQVVV